MASDERALATWLAGRDDRELADIFLARGVSPSAPWKDFFDAADALLEKTSVDRAMIHLTRGELIALAATVDGRPLPASATPPSARLALTGDDGAPWHPVLSALRDIRAQFPDAFEPVEGEIEPAPASEEETLAAAERVFATVGSLADVLVAASHAPLARITSGGVSAADRRKLLDAGALGESDELDDIVGAAAAAGLLTSSGRDWTVSDSGARWLEASTPERWRLVVTGFRDALPSGVRTPSGGYLPVSAWTRRYPLDAEWERRSEGLARIALQWGLLTPDSREPAWATSLRHGDDPQTDELTRHLPAEIDRVYLQADLTAIAPGPLAPRLELRLRRLAARESRAQASTYRFTAESLTAGLTEGETAESIREFLTALSLTGLPQPLGYLIDSTAARHGLIRVRTDAATQRTMVESGDPSLLDAVSVDQGLRALGLVADGAALTTGVSQETVAWALSDARYPVVSVGDDGRPVVLRHRVRPSSDRPEAPAEPHAALIRVLRGSHGDDAENAWLEREIVQAVRSRAVIDVVVRMPDGAERTFTLEATGFGGGRLRGRDQSSDVERTLPLSHVVTVRSVA
ncbi:XPB/Ssl2-like helicase family protein [Microbacterium sp. SLBN-154]|uniref:helicase-associated domain-containing protein n=1 Tax=Microbacterium sp. SLBN-154 TaxID=2768458 RepID=UPI00117376E0|nr:helicase-associated domain-containing protein [Microbacterium sp. SLBN-154]TQK20180.1 XPB/Ssl2-like helicase family protein [Microbacterium sp. SLBN-154]